MERFHLYNADSLIATFTHTLTELGEDSYDVNVIKPDELPIQLRKSCSNEHFDTWINRRSVPVNRHHMEAMLGALNLKTAFEIMRYSHALSLNDTFWIKEESENVTFAEINLYDNKFDEALGWIAFTGLPSDISRNLSTPELTTEGVLPKYWQRLSVDEIVLCKGGTSGYLNAGYEPYREVAAHIIAKHLGIEAIPYHLEKRNDKIVSVSKLFTSKETGLITGGSYIEYNALVAGPRRMGAFLEYANRDGIDLKGFYEMCFLDYIIENFDRHLNNWGFKVNNRTQKIVGFSPVWDNGMSLDFGKPKDLRARFDFSSFAVSYDFVKTCEYHTDFKKRVHKLLIKIKSNELYNDIHEATNDYYPSADLHKNTVQFVQERCLEFLKPKELQN